MYIQKVTKRENICWHLPHGARNSLQNKLQVRDYSLLSCKSFLPLDDGHRTLKKCERKMVFNLKTPQRLGWISEPRVVIWQSWKVLILETPLRRLDNGDLILKKKKREREMSWQVLLVIKTMLVNLRLQVQINLYLFLKKNLVNIRSIKFFFIKIKIGV